MISFYFLKLESYAKNAAEKLWITKVYKLECGSLCITQHGFQELSVSNANVHYVYLCTIYVYFMYRYFS